MCGSCIEVVLDGLDGGVVDGEEALFVAFAVDEECAFDGVEVRDVEVDDFSGAQAAGVEDFDMRPLTMILLRSDSDAMSGWTR